jgi:hypothetical protein
MNRTLKGAAIAALIGAAALASVTPSEARNRWIGPAAAGFAAGAIVGSAASGAYAYGPNYYGGPAYSSGYAYESAPAYDSYAYESEPVYTAPRYYRYGGDRSGCATQGNYGQIDRSACNQ